MPRFWAEMCTHFGFPSQCFHALKAIAHMRWANLCTYSDALSQRVDALIVFVLRCLANLCTDSDVSSQLFLGSKDLFSCSGPICSCNVFYVETRIRTMGNATTLLKGAQATLKSKFLHTFQHKIARTCQHKIPEPVNTKSQNLSTQNPRTCQHKIPEPVYTKKRFWDFVLTGSGILC